MPVQPCASHATLMNLVTKTRQSLKNKGSAGAVALAEFNDKLKEANQCAVNYPGRRDLIASCKAHTVNEALWAAGVRNAPVSNVSCNGRKGPTANSPEEWAGNIFVPAKGGRKSAKSRRSAKKTRRNKKY